MQQLRVVFIHSRCAMKFISKIVLVPNGKPVTSGAEVTMPAFTSTPTRCIGGKTPGLEGRSPANMYLNTPHLRCRVNDVIIQSTRTRTRQHDERLLFWGGGGELH